MQFDSKGLELKVKQALGVRAGVIKKTYDYFKAVTPIRSGNARRNTKLENNKITADYEYAGVLDAGRKVTGKKLTGSTQAPKGMSKPTVAYLKSLVAAYIKTIGK